MKPCAPHLMFFNLIIYACYGNQEELNYIVLESISLFFPCICGSLKNSNALFVFRLLEMLLIKKESSKAYHWLKAQVNSLLMKHPWMYWQPSAASSVNMHCFEQFMPLTYSYISDKALISTWPAHSCVKNTTKEQIIWFLPSWVQWQWSSQLITKYMQVIN